MRNGEWTWGEGGKEQRKKEKKSTCAQIKKVEKSESVQQETITHPLIGVKGYVNITTSLYSMIITICTELNKYIGQNGRNVRWPRRRTVYCSGSHRVTPVSPRVALATSRREDPVSRA